MGQVARRSASVLKRKKSKNKMDASCVTPSMSSSSVPQEFNGGSTTVAQTIICGPAGSTSTNVVAASSSTDATRRGSENDLVFYIDEPKAGNG